MLRRGFWDNYKVSWDKITLTATKKTTTRAITRASTVQPSKEASDIRRLGGVAKSLDRVAPDGTVASARPRELGGLSARTEQGHDPIASG